MKSYLKKKKRFRILVCSITCVIVFSFILIPEINFKVIEGILLILFLFMGYALIEKKLELKLIKKDFKKEKKLIFDIFKNALDVIYYKDLDFKFQDFNDAFCELFSIKKADAIGKTFFDILKTNDAERVEKYDKEVIKTKKSITYEIALYAGNNKEKSFLQVVKSPLFDEKGNVSGILGIVRDITKLKEIEYQREDFITMLTHDLKTPLISQIKALDLMFTEKFGVVKNEQKEILQQIQDSCRYMQQMVNIISETYKYENEDYKYKKEEFDFIRLVEDCYNELNYLAIDKNIQLQFIKNKEDNLIIVSDYLIMRRVVTNFIFNSISYSLSGTKIDIVVDTVDNELSFVIYISNQYFERELIEQLFEKYFVVKNKFRQIGAGLGLYFTKMILLDLDGELIIKGNLDDKNKINSFGFKIKRDIKMRKKIKEKIMA